MPKTQNEQLFDLNEQLHYENNDPAHRQSIYFNLDDEFADRLTQMFVQAHKEATKLSYETGPVFAYIREQMARQLGKLTLPQLLYVTHFISGQMAFNEGIHIGFEEGYGEAVRTERQFNSGKRPGNQSFNGPVGVA